MKRLTRRALGASLFVLLVGCSNSEQSEGDHTSGGAAGGPEPVLEGSTTLTNGSTQDSPAGEIAFSRSASGGCNIKVGESACAGVAFEQESTLLDIYIMFDQTGSMCSCVDPPLIGNPCPDPNCRKTRIDAIRDAMSQFLADPKSAGIGVGVGYFGQLPIGQASCDPSTYAAASVGIAPLPQQATALMTSLKSVNPTGETATGAAIRGACSYAQSWQKTVPSHKVVILLVTDGLPEAPVSCPRGTCCPTLDDSVQAAQACREGKLGINTYVLGVGPYLDNLQKIAEAGGTSKAYLVGTGNVSADVLAALNSIRGDATIPCRFALPPSPAGQVLATNQVNIAYADASCNGSLFYRVQSASECNALGGWHYDSPDSPSNVVLCPSTCEQVSVPGGQLLYSVGCNSLVRLQ